MSSSNPTDLPDIPYSLSKGQPTPTLPPSIVIDASLPTIIRTTPITSTTVLALTTTTTTPRASEQAKSSVASPNDNLTNSELTAIIVVPIILLAILSPILVVWFLSWRRRKRNRCQLSTPQKTILLEDEKEKSSMGTPPQERSHRRSSPTIRNTASLPPPPRPPRKDLEQRRSAEQFSTSPMPVNTDLSGFNFDFSRRASVRASVLSEQTGEDTNFRPTRPPRPSSTHTWNIFPPPTPSPVAIATPYFPPQMQNPYLFEKQANSITPVAPLSPPTGEIIQTLPHPNMYGKVHTSSSTRPLSDENLSVHNGSNHPRIVSSHPPHLDAVSEISGFSFDHDVWAASLRPTQEMDAVSEMSVQEEKRPDSDINPHQMV